MIGEGECCVIPEGKVKKEFLPLEAAGTRYTVVLYRIVKGVALHLSPRWTFECTIE